MTMIMIDYLAGALKDSWVATDFDIRKRFICQFHPLLSGGKGKKSLTIDDVQVGFWHEKKHSHSRFASYICYFMYVTSVIKIIQYK